MPAHPIELRGRTVVVVGLGASGVAALELCQREGARVRGLDQREPSAATEALRARGFAIELGAHHAGQFSDADLVVVSPGVPPLDVLDAVEARGVPVIGELELAAQRIEAPILAIGGTNGKSTTTTLVGCMLAARSEAIFVGGNLGEPACHATERPHDWVVLEVSSFQLERAPSFAPRVSVLLNVSEDHLDRYPDYGAYVRAKGNAFVNQRDTDTAVVPAGDPACLEQAQRGRGKLVRFGAGGDFEVLGGRLVEAATGQGLLVEQLPLFGRHNLDNLAAAVAAVRAVGLEFAEIERGLQTFRPLSHRMQRVRVLDGVSYYDDSKGTNVGAAVTAVSGLPEARCVLIAGGRDKQGSYEPLVAALEQRGRALIVLGEAAERIEQAALGRIPTWHASSMQDAVSQAQLHAQPGDAVLLSPACSSFDMFSGYAERGRVFAAAVAGLVPLAARG